MSRTDTLMMIKEAEIEARAIIDKAMSDSKNAVATARRESVNKIQEAEAQFRKDYETAIAKEVKDLEAERDKLLSSGRDKAAQLDKAAAARIEKVKDFLKKEFERTLDATS